MKHIYRHGDFLFEPVKEVAKEAVAITKDALGLKPSKAFTFGVGEATGHNHTAVVDDITKMNWFRAPNGGWYVKLDTEARLTHPEHSVVKNLVIAPGIYRVKQAKEFDWFQVVERRVID